MYGTCEAKHFICTGLVIWYGTLMHKRVINMTGMRFGHWTILHEGEGKDSCNGLKWVGRCECGTIRELSGKRLRRGNTKSCGCARNYYRWKDIPKKEKIKKPDGRKGRPKRENNLTDNPLYRTWSGMIQRCKCEKSPSYKNYGGRGIKVCEKWLNFFEFEKDMGPKPEGKFSLDRVNNEGNYEPNNCRWATAKEQCANKRKKYVTQKNINFILGNT